MNASVIQLGTGKHLPHCGCATCAARTEHIVLASAPVREPARTVESRVRRTFFQRLRTRIARLRDRGLHVDDQDRDALIFLAGTLWGALVSVGTIAALFAATAGAH